MWRGFGELLELGRRSSDILKSVAPGAWYVST